MKRLFTLLIFSLLVVNVNADEFEIKNIGITDGKVEIGYKINGFRPTIVDTITSKEVLEILETEMLALRIKNEVIEARNDNGKRAIQYIGVSLCEALAVLSLSFFICASIIPLYLLVTFAIIFVQHRWLVKKCK